MTTTNCDECHAPCELHGVTFCATCHKHEGECDFGHCTSRATAIFDFPGVETRGFCRKHATAPHFEFARAGGIRRAK